MNQDRLMQETVEDGSFFCFQGADFEVHPAKIIQVEAAFAKRKFNLLFTVENADLRKRGKICI